MRREVAAREATAVAVFVAMWRLLQAPLDTEDANQLASALKVIADPARLRLLSLIRPSPAMRPASVTSPNRLDSASRRSATT
jgi:hypothetical protein